nr:hypothetical protein Iba_scaffold47250CG0070 [Ipomoea batatas]GME09035.1 hypothetical protein Iba_scaffold8103CG0020 [Ipomoea batatas]
MEKKVFVKGCAHAIKIRSGALCRRAAREKWQCAEEKKKQTCREEERWLLRWRRGAATCDDGGSVTDRGAVEQIRSRRVETCCTSAWWRDVWSKRECDGGGVNSGCDGGGLRSGVRRQWRELWVRQR